MLLALGQGFGWDRGRRLLMRVGFARRTRVLGLLPLLLSVGRLVEAGALGSSLALETNVPFTDGCRPLLSGHGAMGILFDPLLTSLLSPAAGAAEPVQPRSAVRPLGNLR